MKRTAQLWTLGAGLVATAFALRTLSLIDATALWSDELYSVGKSFQPSLGVLLDMLRQDTHPPLYYVLLWIWGQLLGQTPVSLRLLSWLAYLAGGSVMVAQAVALGDGRQRVLPLALLLAFCSPYTPCASRLREKAMPCWCCWWHWPGGGVVQNDPCSTD